MQDGNAINKLFNVQLQQQVLGTLPKGHVYELGFPDEILSSIGIPNSPIQLRAEKLAEKAHENYGHPFDLLDVKDLPKAVQNPLAVFSYGDKSKAVNIITEIEKNEKKFLAGMALNPEVGGRNIDIHSIRTIFPKDTHEWITWINQGKGVYFNKEKTLGLLANRRHPADVAETALKSATKIVQNFQNPTL
jgi:hypothetical protein